MPSMRSQGAARGNAAAAARRRAVPVFAVPQPRAAVHQGVAYGRVVLRAYRVVSERQAVPLIREIPRSLPRPLPRLTRTLRPVQFTSVREIQMFKFVSATLAIMAGALSLTAQAHGPGRNYDDPTVVTQWNTIAEANIPASAGVLLP